MNKASLKTLGILGGGQLGQMSAIAAKKLGLKTVIFTPEENSPASLVADETIIGAYEDEDTLSRFAQKVDVISYEFENIPVKTVEYLKTLKPVYPDTALLDVSQDRIKEKSFLNEIGIPTAKWSPAQTVSDVENTLKEWNTAQCIIKTARFGYDGKGQAFITDDDDITQRWNSLNSDHIIIEQVINFKCEISVIIARDLQGNTACFDPGLNEHKNHILHKTTVPAPIPDTLKEQAINMAETLAHKVNLVGVLGLELFVTEDHELLANEIAPRTHNSGHWTIDACECSQFEQHVRAVCGLPLGNPARHANATMINLIGEDITHTNQYKDNPNAHIHNYGKTEIKPGRKMGHVTLLEDQP